MTGLTQRWRLPWRSLVVATIAIVVAATSGGATAFGLERELVVSGEWWRCLTGHFAHGSSYHLWWNILPLLGLGLLWEPILGRRYWGLFGLSALVVGAGLVALDPGMIGYVGLSGVLNGIWTAGALLAARQEAERGSRWQWLYIGFVAADLGKIAFETFSGLQLFTESSALGVHAVPLAHALGALSGVLWVFLVGRTITLARSDRVAQPPIFLRSDNRCTKRRPSSASSISPAASWDFS